MSNFQRTIARKRNAERQQKKNRQNNMMLLAAVILIIGGLGTLIWMGAQSNEKPTTVFAEQAQAQQGGTAVNFELDSLTGDPVALDDYKGDVIVMNFWATWCPPCRAEMPGLNRFYETHRDDGVVILAINAQESVETVRPFIDANGFTFPVLLDLHGQVAQQYSTRSFPTTFIIDREGTIQHVQTGEISEKELDAIVLPLLQ